MHHTEIEREKEIVSRIRNACRDISQISENRLVVTGAGSHLDPVQTLVMRKGANNDHMIMPMIEAAAIQSEMKAAGAGELFLKIAARCISDDLSRRAVGLDYDREWIQILERAKTSTIPFRKKDIYHLIKSGGDIHRRIINEVFEILKCDDSINVRKVASTKTEISRDSGYIFEGLSVDQRFFSFGNWDRKNVRIAMIDGFIEKVSEIHHFIEEAAQRRQPCIIFCIDALPDVSETLVKNFLSRNLDVILVKIPVTHDHVNTLNDLGVIFGEHPVAASLGDSIGVGITRNQIIADKVLISRGKISIKDSKNKRAVDDHLRGLRSRLENDINLFPVLEPRMQRLKSSVIRVSVGMDDQKLDPNIVERLDRTFRSLPKVLKLGFIEKNDFQGFSSDKIDLLFDVNHEISAEMAIQSVEILLSTRESINSAAIGIKQI